MSVVMAGRIDRRDGCAPPPSWSAELAVRAPCGAHRPGRWRKASGVSQIEVPFDTRRSFVGGSAPHSDGQP